MQLDEEIQQHLFPLPTELKTEVLDFVLFLEQKQEKQAKIRLKSLMSVIPPTVNLADELIADRRLDAEKEQQEMTL